MKIFSRIFSRYAVKRPPCGGGGETPRQFLLVWSEMAAFIKVTAAAVMLAWPETAAVLVMALHEMAAVR